MARKILNYRTFHTAEGFMQWQLDNPLCDVVRISPHGIGGVFVVWREYARDQ